jgi:hypothetical protein
MTEGSDTTTPATTNPLNTTVTIPSTSTTSSTTTTTSDSTTTTSTTLTEDSTTTTTEPPTLAETEPTVPSEPPPPAPEAITLTGSVNPGFLDEGGELSGNLNEGTFLVTGAVKPDANAPYHAPVGGDMSDGSVFQGYLSGVKGSFHGIFDSIFVTPEGDAGFLHSSIEDNTDDSTNFSATGLLTNTETYGNIQLGGQTLASLMDDHSTPANRYLNKIRVPMLPHITSNESGVSIPGWVLWDIYDPSQIMQTDGIELSNGTLLGVWRYSLQDSHYFTPSYDVDPDIEKWEVTYGNVSYSLIGKQYLLGVLEGEYLQDYLNVTGVLDYMDKKYMGKISLEFKGHYGDDPAAVAGGTMNLVPLAWSGDWDSDTFYYNHKGNIKSGKDYGLLGGIDLPWTGTTPESFTAIGEFDIKKQANPFLAHSEFSGKEISGPGRLTGITSSIWKDGNITGASVALYHDSESAGILLSTDVSGKFYRLGQDDSDGMWKLNGTLTKKEMTSDPIDKPLPIKTGSLTASLQSGSFEGQSGGASQTMYYRFDRTDLTIMPWGIYNLMFEGDDHHFSEENPTWSAEVAGTGNFGLGNSNLLRWYAISSGTWSDSGILEGLPEEYKGMDGFFYKDVDGNDLFDSEDLILGIISGTFSGIADEGDEGSWIGQSIGSWEWTENIGSVVAESLYRFDGAAIARVGEDPATIAIVPRGEDKFYFLALGDYSISEGGSAPYLQHTSLSGVFEDGDGSGQFQGFIGSVWSQGTIDGWITAIRSMSDGGAGILLGDAAGGYFSGLENWKAKGDLFYVLLATGLDTDNILFEEKDLAWTGMGSFVDGSAIQVTSSKGSALSIADQSWGVWQTLLGGGYSGISTDDWELHLSDAAQSTQRWIEVSGSKWSAEKVAAQAAGAWVNWDQAGTGVIGGKLKGTFDPAASTWQAVGAGAYMDTNRFLELTATAEGQRKLQQLNIPCIEIGRASLSGNSNLMNVKMNDVTFFAYSNGANPRIWATNGVNGSYSGAPAAGHTVNLSGSGLNADFQVNNWNNQKWGANVSGGGVLTRNAGGTVNVQMQGAAAGQYGNGQFSGTGAGVSR